MACMLSLVACLTGSEDIGDAANFCSCLADWLYCSGEADVGTAELPWAAATALA